MIYVANYMDVASQEAEQDDPSFDLESMASPQLSRLSTRMSAEWVEKCKSQFVGEVQEALGEDLEVRWETSGWVEVSPTNGRRSHQVFDAYDGGLLIGKLVIQRVPCDE